LRRRDKVITGATLVYHFIAWAVVIFLLLVFILSLLRGPL